MALGNNTITTLGLSSTSSPSNAAGSQQIAGVTLSNNSSIPYNEFGYMAVFLNNPDGADPMKGDRFYLVKQVDNVTSTGGDFYFRGNSTARWQESSTEYFPIVDNCIRLKLEYYGNPTSPTGAPTWTTAWSPPDRLPLGVLVTISALDSKTAEKIAAVSNNSPLSEADITAGLNAASGNGTTSGDIQRLISQGSVTMRRFIPFNSQ
jgi:hypothetical protein